MRLIAKAAVNQVNLLWLNFLNDSTYMNFEEYITTCPVPFLYIGSSEPFANFQIIKSLNPQALTAQVVGSGHFVMQNARDQINAMLDRYLSLSLS